MADNPLPELVVEALETALQRDGETPLIKKGKAGGLLPAKSSPERKKAMEACLDEKLGLFTINTITKGKTATQLVTITPTGIETLLKQADPIRRAELMEKASESHRDTVDTVALHLAENDLNRIADEQQRLSEESKQLSEMMIQLMDSQFEQIRKNQDRLEREAEALQAMRRPEHHDSGSTNDAESRIYSELVQAWYDCDDSATRQTLERVMANGGLEQVGIPGDSVNFDADEHRSDDDLAPGQPATVVTPGWVVRLNGGNVPITKITVEALRPLEEEEMDSMV